jgi:hypothetical protein
MPNAARYTAGLMGKTPVLRPPPQSGGGLADMDAGAKIWVAMMASSNPSLLAWCTHGGGGDGGLALSIKHPWVELVGFRLG